MNYPLGQTVIPRLTFKDRNKVLVDVTTVFVEVQPPVSPAYTYSGPFGHPSVGVYEFLISANEAGIWRGEAHGSIAGDGTAVARFNFCVQPDYVMAGP